tara:strand:+ start:246 stop:434 length:189 start_codon:yes stop_codon:yes gene_type:complete
MKIRVGDLVHSVIKNVTGIVVGFNEKGEGGQDFVHVLVNGDIVVCMSWDTQVIDPSKPGRGN